MILIIKIVISFTLDFRVFSNSSGNVEAWIGYWGSYLGGVIGLIAVIITTKYLIDNQNQQHKELLEEFVFRQYNK